MFAGRDSDDCAETIKRSVAALHKSK
jgi:hypothetical protein